MANQVLSGRKRPKMRDSTRVAFAVAPKWMQRPVFRHRMWEVPWLLPGIRKDFERRFAHAQAEEPHRWDRWIGWFANRRSVDLALRSMTALTREVDALLVQPLIEPGVLVALGEAGRTRGIGDRTHLMRSLFDTLLPDVLLARPDKARFGQAFRGEPSRAFARDWQGEGVDTDLVDPAALQRDWQSESMSFRSAFLMQAAWLHQHGD